MPGILAKQDVMDNPKKTEEGNGTTADIKFDAELLKGGEKGEEVHRLKEVLNTIKMSDCVSGEELGTQRSTTPDSGVCVCVWQYHKPIDVGLTINPLMWALP